jgi:hypothetical protein
MKYIKIQIILILLLLIIIFFLNYNQRYDFFSNSNKYLYPTQDLSEICSKENLYPSFMPKACYVDGNLNSYANCKCEDKDGNCKKCYDTIKKNNNETNIVYNANNS